MIRKESVIESNYGLFSYHRRETKRRGEGRVKKEGEISMCRKKKCMAVPDEHVRDAANAKKEYVRIKEHSYRMGEDENSIYEFDMDCVNEMNHRIVTEKR